MALAAFLLVAVAQLIVVREELHEVPTPAALTWTAVGSFLVGEGLLAWGLLEPAFFTISHWAPLIAPILIMGLVRRGALRAAGALAVGIFAVSLAAATARGIWDGPGWTAVWLPSALTLLVGIRLRGFFHYSDLVRRRELDETLRSNLVRTEAAAVEQTAARRRGELARSVRPLLAEIAQGGDLDSGLRQRAAVAAHELRDGLRARQVITEEIRELLFTTRRAGTTVAVVDDRPQPRDDEVSVLARQVISHTLPGAEGGEVTYRISPEGRVTCVVTELPTEPLEEIARILTALGASVVLTDEALWAQAG